VERACQWSHISQLAAKRSSTAVLSESPSIHSPLSTVRPPSDWQPPPPPPPLLCRHAMNCKVSQSNLVDARIVDHLHPMFRALAAGTAAGAPWAGDAGGHGPRRAPSSRSHSLSLLHALPGRPCMLPRRLSLTLWDRLQALAKNHQPNKPACQHAAPKCILPPASPKRKSSRLVIRLCTSQQGCRRRSVGEI
jgi:hypothetical protein